MTDHGQWRPPRGENRGRGLPLMRTLMDEVDVRHTDEGTSVTLITHAGVTVLANITGELRGSMAIAHVTARSTPPTSSGSRSGSACR